MALTLESTVASPPRIDRMMPRRLDSAFFGIGCFFNTEPRFALTKGVWRTVVGYAGGRYETPSYKNQGDHMEVVMVEYDPLTLSYGQLLDIFLNLRSGRFFFSRNAGGQNVFRVFAKNEFEKRLAQAAAVRYELSYGKEECVNVTMHKAFYKAEVWCQKYFLREFQPLLSELSRVYPDEESLIHSTLATRLNGLLGQMAFKEFPASYIPEDFEFYDLSDGALSILKNAMICSG